MWRTSFYSHKISVLGVMGFALIGLLGFHDFLERILMAGSAWLVGAYLGIPAEWQQGAWWIWQVDPVLKISPACSGTTFFIAICLLWLWIGITELSTGSFWRQLGWVPLGTLFFTLGVNAARILVSHAVYRISVDHLDPAGLARMHTLSGVITFLPALVLFFICIRWRRSYALPDPSAL